MRFVLVLLSVACVAVGASVSVSDYDDVRRLADANSVVLVKFCASHHPPCIPIIHMWREVADTLERAEAVVADYDGPPSSAFPQQMGVKEYPAMFFFVNGTMGVYRGEFVTKDVLIFARGLQHPEVEKVEKIEEILRLQRKRGVVLAHFQDDGDLMLKNEVAENAFTNVASMLRGMVAFVRAPIKARPMVHESPFVMWTIDGDARDIHASLYNDSARLAHAVRVARMPALDELQPETYDEYLRLHIPLVWLFEKRTACEGKGGACAVMRALAPSFRGRACFFWVDAIKYGMVSKRLGLSGETFPAVTVDVEQTHHFAYEEGAPITEDRVRNFLDAVLRGDVPPSITSEPAPEKHTVRGLTKIVGATLDELLYDENMDVVLQFTSSECDECSFFDESYEEIAQEYSRRGVRIARMDVARNDYSVRAFKFDRLPAFFFVRRGQRKIEAYAGRPDDDELRAYISSRMTDRHLAYDEL